ncbi:MAG: DUF4136 domain-containing protein [Candidatus Korobacteraceae bacterium]
MKTNRLFLALAFCMLVSASALAQQTNVDWDRSTNFSQFHTYAWQPSPKPATGLWDQRITDGVNQQLQAKGLQLAMPGTDPDLWVVYTSHIKDQSQVVGTGYNFGPAWGWGPWWGGPQTVTYSTFITKEGTLVVEMANAKTHELEWRGSVTDTIKDNSNKNIKNLDKAITKLFKNYPPSEGKK